MPFSNQIPPFVKRHPATTALATIGLAVASLFVIKGGGNNDILQKWDAASRSHGSGAITGSVTKAYMTSSGALALSGALRLDAHGSGSCIEMKSNNAGAVGCCHMKADFSGLACNAGACPSDCY